MMKVAYKREEYTIEKTESCILKMLAYFSVFDYPLTKDEIKRFLPPKAKTASFENALTHLVMARSIYKVDEFYLLQDDLRLVKRRRDNNFRAKQLLPKAIRIGKFLSCFPYVTGVGISGSLSKMDAHEKRILIFLSSLRPIVSG